MLATEDQKENFKSYYKKNKKVALLRTKKWQEENPEAVKAAKERYKRRHPEMNLLHRAKQNAKGRGLVCTITKEDIEIPQTCPYLGIQLTWTIGEGRLPTTASIDRIDSTKGYIPGNIEIISELANRMKTNATQEQLICFAKAILERFEKGDTA